MSETGPASGATWRYRFSKPGGVEVETRELDGDDAAESYAIELSKDQDSPIVVHRLIRDEDWRYLTEADER